MKNGCTKINEDTWDIKCAGMPDKCKDYFMSHYKLTDFKVGLRVPGKLKPVRIKGGTLLVDDYYTMRKM